MILYDCESIITKNRKFSGMLFFSPESDEIVQSQERYFEPSYPYGSPYIVFVCRVCGKIIYTEPIVNELYCTCSYSVKMIQQKHAIYLSHLPFNRTHVWGGMPIYWSVAECKPKQTRYFLAKDSE